MKRLGFLLGMLVYCLAVCGQNIVGVNEFTGTVNAAIPLYSIQSGGVSLPVSLFHSGTGVRIKDVEGTAGMNWYLSAGGKISRHLRDLPDDCKKNYKNQERLGWLHIPNTGTNWTKIGNFTIANDGSQANCTDETADINYINTNFNDLSDTEPDIFNVSAPGLSCQLMFDNNRIIRTMPYMNIKVSYVLDTTGRINSFTIINDRGIKYEFANAQMMSRGTYTTKPDSVKFFKRTYEQYIARPDGSPITYSPGIEYNSAWDLTRISDPNGNFIKLGYIVDAVMEPGDDDNNLYENSVDSVNLVRGTAGNTFKRSFQYKLYTKQLPWHLNYITFGHGPVTQDSLKFEISKTYSGVRIIKKITGFGKQYDFTYARAYHKSYLKTVSIPEDGCIQRPQYEFDYNGLTADPDSAGKYDIDIPDSTSRRMDQWGYFNNSTDTTLTPQLYVNPSNTSLERYRSVNPGGSLSSYTQLLAGSTRRTDTTAVLLGALSKINYREGGYTTLAYESNRFYDPTAGTVVFGGGIRIKSITDYDGLNVANNIVRTYSYINPTTSLSSGKIISMPVYAFTTTYSGSGSTLDKWNYSTMRSEDNLSEENNGVIYSHVRVSQNGAGSTLYEFKTPATNWDASASPDWAPTMTYLARTNCPTTNFAANQEDTYPFAPNIDFDFERGLISKMTAYSGVSPFNAVTETSFTYTRSGSPFVIEAFRWENNGTSKAYAKYKVFTSVSEQTTQQIKKLYDLQNPTQAQQSTVNSYYTGTTHKLMTRQETTVSDGSTVNTYTKYTKDYTVTPGIDSTINAIYRLQQLNINTPVESYTQVTRSGVAKTIGAGLTRFKTFNPTGSAYMILPAQQLKFTSVDGVTDFTPSTISGTFTNDSRYIVLSNNQAYDFCGAPLSSDNNRKGVGTVIIDHKTGSTVAAISNAKYNEIGYNDFNSDITDVKFTKATYSYSTNSRSGQYALSLAA
ncbi:MAG TPA: hypothetical protein VK541_22075, partial [Pedobacter sp.]|uniref:hypothetical protein n=1 Tax=Pedobacter sp. TaxID=1411316 RepID=UPI002C17A340